MVVVVDLVQRCVRSNERGRTGVGTFSGTLAVTGLARDGTGLAARAQDNPLETNQYSHQNEGKKSNLIAIKMPFVPCPLV